MKKKNEHEERFFFWVFIVFIVVILILLLFKKTRSSFLSVFLPTLQPREKKKVTFQGEETTRSILEAIFNQEFPKVKPIWLVNPRTKKKLELDGFNPNIKTPLGKGLAFEYNGSQHVHFNPRFHKTMKNFEDQKFRDEIKAQRCREKGVLLISVPYVLTTRKEIERFVMSKLGWLKKDIGSSS